jgi:hypothetical protein
MSMANTAMETKQDWFLKIFSNIKKKQNNGGRVAAWERHIK